jgi:hypothetical protein
MSDFVLFLVFVSACVFICCLFKSDKRTPEQKRIDDAADAAKNAEINRKLLIDTYGNLNPVMICPHCREKGHTRTKEVKRKKGVSGAKVTGAILTFGVSMLATGLSRKEGLTQAHCDNCGATWDF